MSTKELDAIYNHLFAESRDCYALEEYDDNDILIYTPPPLDQVWLSEGERWERCIKLVKQRQRNEKYKRDAASCIIQE